jgi:hypothetical protein
MLLYWLEPGNFKVVSSFLLLEAALQFPSHVLFDDVFAVNEVAVNVWKGLQLARLIVRLLT